jgi:hypothetical protein
MRLNVEQEFKRFPFQVSHMREDLKDIVECNVKHLVFPRREGFYTVGSASYKDKDNYSQAEYEKMVERSNASLKSTFPEFYRFQLEYFEWLLNAPVKYMKGVSIPGFHYFKYHPDFKKPLARPHVDVPFNKFDWGEKVGYHTIFTHVIPVEIPPNAGMWVWDVTADDINVHGFEKCKDFVERTKPFDFVKHEVDSMVFHSGRFVHQIKPFDEETPFCRITLQSHAVRIDDIWYLYW